MKCICTALLADEAGFILSAELVLIATVAVLGLTAVMVGVRDSIGGEMADLAHSFRKIDQSYGYSSMRGCRTRTGYTSFTAGSGYLDSTLHPDGSEQDFTIEDHVVGTTSFEKKIPCPVPAPAVPACPAFPCPTTPAIPTPPMSALPMFSPEWSTSGVSGPKLPAPEDAPSIGKMLIAPHDNSSPGMQSASSQVSGQPWSAGDQQQEFPIDPLFRRPTPSSDIPPGSVWRSGDAYSPPFSQPYFTIPAGPLQVW